LQSGCTGLWKHLIIDKEDRRFSREDGGFFIGLCVAGILSASSGQALPAIRGRDALDTGPDRTEGGKNAKIKM
jgi:hypothetical protein